MDSKFAYLKVPGMLRSIYLIFYFLTRYEELLVIPLNKQTYHLQDITIRSTQQMSSEDTETGLTEDLRQSQWIRTSSAEYASKRSMRRHSALPRASTPRENITIILNKILNC